MSLKIATINGLFETALERLAEHEGTRLAEEIKPILSTNLARGRISSEFLSSPVDIHDYVSKLAANFKNLSSHIHQLQVEKNEDVWRELFEQMAKWAYAYLLRKNFRPEQNTVEIAKGCATEASIQILKSHFPYDVEFDLWCRRVLSNTCSKYLRTHGRREKNLPMLAEPIEELAEVIADLNTPDPMIEQELFHTLLDGLAQLSASRTYVIRRYYFELASFEEIAKELGKSVAAIHSLHFNALEDLRKVLRIKGHRS